MVHKIDPDKLKDEDFQNNRIFVVDASKDDTFVEDYSKIIEDIANQLSESINWLTNLSIALLGFFLALLLQLKFKNYSISTFLPIASLSLISISVAIGLYFKIKYDFQKLINRTLNFLNNANVEAYYSSKDENHRIQDLLESNLERKKNLFSGAIYFQVCCFLISISFVAIYLLDILFFQN